MPAPESLEALLAHRGWMRGLARSLVADASRSDDLEQEVWRRALSRPPRDRRSPRGWLASVLRRAAVDGHRSDARRARHEAAVATRDEAPAATTRSAGEESRRRLVRAVMAMDERYRAVVLLRWFEGLPPREVARRLGVPVETVRTRLKRALPLLRQRLDAAHGGDGRSWAIALAPLAGGPASATSPTFSWGALVMGTKSKLTVAVVVLMAVLGVLLWSLSVTFDDSVPPLGPASPDADPILADATDPGAPGRLRGPDDEPGEAGSTSVAEDAPAGGGAVSSRAPGVRFGTAEDEHGAGRVGGRVTDLDGRPIPGAVVSVVDFPRPLRPGETLPQPGEAVRTDGDGRFEFAPLAPVEGYRHVRIRAPGYRPEVAVLPPGKPRVRVTLGPVFRLAGSVVDETDGAPIAGVFLFVYPEGSRTTGPSFVSSTNEEGRFDYGDRLGEGRWSLDVNRHGTGGSTARRYVPLVVERVGSDAGDLRIGLTLGLTIAGVLLDATGAPVTTGFSADVLGRTEQGNPDYSSSAHQRVENADGAFRFSGLASGLYDVIVKPDRAGSGGADSALVSATVVRDVAAGTEDLRVTLVPGSPLEGRLVDDAGEPVRGMGYIYVYPEGSSAGGEDSVAVPPDGEGRFRTAPLDAGRRYEVYANGFPGYMSGRAKGLVPGDPGISITLRRARAISGKVVDPDGKAVGRGVPVTARAEGDVDWTKQGTNMTSYTAADGTFRLDGLGEHRFHVVAGGGETPWAHGAEREGIAVGKTDLKLSVRRGVTMTGRLVDEYGRPFRTHLLSAHPDPGDGGAGSTTRVADEDGKFTLRGLPPGKVTLSCFRGKTFVNLGTFEAPAEGLEITVPSE